MQMEEQQQTTEQFQSMEIQTEVFTLLTAMLQIPAKFL